MSSNEIKEIEINWSDAGVEEAPAIAPPVTTVSSLPPSPAPTSLIADDEALAMSTAKADTLKKFLDLLCHGSRFEDFLHEILLTITGAVHCEAASVLELDPEKKILFFRAAIGQSAENLSAVEIPSGHGIVGHVAESQQQLIVNDPEESAVHLKTVPRAVGFQAKNIAALPLIIRGRTFGVVELLNRIGEKSFTQADEEVLTYLCAAAARTIEIRLMIGWAMKVHEEATRKTA